MNAQALRVLVVDDNALFQRLLIKWIVEMGHAAVGAVDGLSALEAMREDKADVVVTDLMMPGMDGLELTRNLRKAQVRRGLYVLLVTADASRERMREAWDAGVDDFLGKPLKRDELEARLRIAARMKRLEEDVVMHTRLSDERERLALALKEQERLVAVIAHELRTPLGGMRMVGDILAMHRDDLPDAAQRAVDMLQRQVLGMVGTLENLLATSVRGDREAGCWGPFDADAVGGQALALVEHLVPAKARLRMRFPEPLPMVGDADRVRRLLVNLMTNALRHVGEGEVMLSGRRLAPDQIELSVQDTGPGISPRVMAVLGEPLLLNASNLDVDRKAHGSGLGLAVCKEIAGRHGGALFVESATGTGTRVRAQLRTDLEGPSTVPSDDCLYSRPLPCRLPESAGQCQECSDSCLYRGRSC